MILIIAFVGAPSARAGQHRFCYVPLCLSGTDNGRVRFWRLDSGTGESFEAHSNTVCALATTRDCWRSLMLASACFEGTIVVWAVDGLKDDGKVRKDNVLGRGRWESTPEVTISF